MKKVFLLLCTATVILSGCTMTPSHTTNGSGDVSGGIVSNNTEKSVAFLLSEYASSPTKPKNIDTIKNLSYMMSGFSGAWNMKFEVPTYDTGICTGNIRFLSTERYVNRYNHRGPEGDGVVAQWPAKIAKPGSTINLTGNYIGPGFGFGLTKDNLAQINNRGWLMFKPETVNSMIQRYFYQSDSTTYDGLRPEEWIHLYKQLGGEKDEYKRYPYHTVFLSSDMLLHIRYKLFEQQLKHYEETTARQTIKDISDTQFARFVQLSKITKNPELKNTYDLLATYRAIPKAILVDTGTITQMIASGVAGEGEQQKSDLTDKELHDVIIKNSKEIVKQLSVQSQERFTATINAILDAKQGKADDHLFSGYTENNLGIEVKQDYSMFKPRSHYTTNSLLKSYFIAVKALSRHKFYNQIDKLAFASAIATKQLGSNSSFDQYNQTITTLIGDNDDIVPATINELLKKHSITSDEQIIGNTKLLADIKALHPQKIMSTTYVSTGNGVISEQDAKSITDGMLVLGEKFTIDSWIFDQITAGPAEKEYPQKGSRTTSLMIPALFDNNQLAQGMIDNRYKLTNSNSSQYLTQRLSFFAGNKNRLNIESNEFTGSSSYYLWFKSLGSLLKPIGRYLDSDELHRMRTLNTYLGSYTELKHATLLYTKQAMAELGGGGDSDCDIDITPPALPVPRGYIEPNKDLNNSLITMTLQLRNILGSNPKLDTVLDFYKFTGKIIDAELKNQIIKDEDFETLRMYDEKLGEALRPDREIGAVMDKEMRASIIADIFTSGEFGPLYIAIGRPYLMLVAIDDVNGRRFVVGPVYSTYEFDNGNNPIKSDSRLNDSDWQKIMGNNADNIEMISGDAEFNIKTLPMKALEINK